MLRVSQLVQLMLPAKPKTVFATFHRGGQNVEVETQTTVVILFDDGTAAQIDVGCVSHQTRPRWLIRGEKAALSSDGGETMLLKSELEGFKGERSVEVEKTEWENYYRNIGDHLNKGAELIVKPEEVRIAMQILDAAFESGRTGRSVEIR